MQVEVKELKDNRKSLFIEIPKEEVERKLSDVYAKISNSASVPGFRKGKAPIKILKLYYGREIKGQVGDELIQEYYKKAVDEKDLRVAFFPEIKKVEFEEGKPLKFEAVVEVFAKFKIGKYKGVEIEREKMEVTKGDVEAVLERKREEHAQLIPVRNRPSQKGDLITVDYQIEIPARQDSAGGDKKVARELKDQKLILGRTAVPKEWEKALTGVKKGDIKEIRVKAKGEKGGDIVYKFTVTDIQERRLVVLTDDFARKLGNFDSLDKVRAKIRAELEEMARLYEEDNLKKAVIGKILQESDIEVPSSMIKKFSEYYRSFNKQMSGEESEKIAEENIKIQLIIDEIAKQEKITITDGELNKRKKEINTQTESEEDLRENLMKEKVLKFLVEKAKIKNKEKRVIVTPEEASSVVNKSGRTSSRKNSIITS